MAALSELQFEEISRLLQKYFLTPLEARIQRSEDILKVVAMRLEKGHSSSETTLSDRLRLRAELISIAESQRPSAEKQDITFYFPDLQQQLDSFIQQQEEVRIEPQVEARFLVQPDDPAWLRTAKYWKRRLRRLDQLKQGSKNWFRTAFGKAAAAPQEWTHEIPWRLLLHQHLQTQLLHRLQEIIDIAERQQIELLKSAFELSSLPDRQPAPARIEILQEAEHRLQRAREQRQHTTDLLHRQIEAVLGRLYIELEEEYHKAGTLELPVKKLKPILLQRKLQQRQQQVAEQLSEWKSTKLSLCNQWSLQLHLHNATDKLNIQLKEARQQWQEGLDTQVFTALEKVANSLGGVKKTLALSPLPAAFTESRQQLRQQVVRQEVAAAAEALAQQDLSGQLQALEAPLQEHLAALPAQTILGPAVAAKEPAPVPASALTTIQPRELVSLEVLPLAVRKLLQLRNEVLQQVEELRLRLGEMEEMSLFNLDSAHAYWEQHPQEEQKARAIAFEGIDRTLAQTALLQERLRQLSTSTWQEIDQLHERISKSLFGLSNLENVKSLQLRLFKARALQRKESLQEKAQKQVNVLLPRAQQFLQETLSFAGKQQKRLRSRLGIETPPAAIATELSDFLADNELALQRLPFVYQRLYNVEPLTDELFMIGRTTELQAMQDAYRRWQEGKFSPMLVSGEKGSGTTSLLNIFLRRLPHQQKVARLALSGKAGASLADLAEALAGPLGLPAQTSWQQLHEYLLKPQAQLVLVVEDLQHLFRRWVGGFEVMKAFLELVSLSSKSVFWLCSCSIYSWQYLDRVIFASETWGRVVFLQEFTQAQLHELIMRRHRVSGYQLQYEPSAGDLQNKKFVALPAEEKQVYLEQKYFQKLSLFAQSNLRLALLYWLRSTLSVTKNGVVISTSLNPEFSFLLSMPPARYFSLHALLLHDRLNPAELAQIFGENETTQRRQLQMLFDDGLLLRYPDGYSLNPLLYRQIVNVLKQKNLVH